MKTFRFFGFEVRFFFSLMRFRTLTFDLPEWADDVCITTCDIYDNDIPHTIKYYKGFHRFDIELPMCTDAKAVSITPKYSIIDGKRSRTPDRKIIVEIFK
jgi:hypothetical protein